jgi:hypothetical protein
MGRKISACLSRPHGSSPDLGADEAILVHLTLLSSIYNALRDLGLDGWLPDSLLTKVG